MAVAPRFVLPFQTVIGSTGTPLPGALLNFYLTGSSTRANTYTDAGLATPNANPVVALDNGMFPAIFLDPNIIYKAVLTDETAVPQWTADPVQGYAVGGLPLAATFEDISDTNFPAGTSMVTTSGWSVSGVGAARYAPTANTGETPYRTQSADGQWWQLAEPILTPEMVGAIGDGVADDSTAITALFALVSAGASSGVHGVVAYLTGVYKITGRPDLDLRSAMLLGIPGKTKITGAFGYELIRITGFSNAVIDGIIFENTYSNAAVGGSGLIYTNFGVPISNAFVRRCQFTVPNANTGALFFYADTGVMGQNGTIDGLWVEDNVFHDIGQIAVTFMNRSGAASHAKRVYCDRNKFKNLGAINANGFAVSFDGVGEAFTCNDNVLENCRGYGLENTGWGDGTFERNTFDVFSNTWAPFSFSSGATTNNIIADNRCLSAANAVMPMYLMNKSVFRGNYFSASTSVFEFRAVSEVHFENDNYVSAATSIVTVEDVGGNSQNNIWRDCIFDNSAAVSTNGLLVFDGAGTNYNRVYGCTAIKATGGTQVLQQNSSVNNLVVDLYDGAGTRLNQFVGFAMPDSDTTVTGDAALYDADVLIIDNGGIAGTHTLTLDVMTWAKSKPVINNSGHSVILGGPGGAGSTLASADRKIVMYRADVQQFFVTN